jgi:hypothetical protein
MHLQFTKVPSECLREPGTIKVCATPAKTGTSINTNELLTGKEFIFRPTKFIT